MNEMKPVRVRFAPSPTGDPHFGSARTALFNYLFAKHNAGTFIFRLEDTDKVREIEGSEDKLYEVMDWLGITPDESSHHGGNYGPYKQSERLDLYKKYAQELIEKNHAYYCFCTSERLTLLREEQAKNKQAPRYDRHCLTLASDEIAKRVAAQEACVIRLKMPENEEIGWQDAIKGDMVFQSNEIDDQVLMKSDGYPTYHLANVVDDHLMEISHVIRAEEWLSSTPKHLVLYKAFGWQPPLYAHVPLILGTDRSKMSKRHGHTSTVYYKNDCGYLSQAMTHFMAFMGWTPEHVQESYTLEELVRDFSLERVGSSPAIFDQARLDSLGLQYMQQTDFKEVYDQFGQWLEKQETDSAVRFQDIMKSDAEYARAIIDVARLRSAHFTQTLEVADQYFVTTSPSAADLTLDGKISHELAQQGLKVVLAGIESIADMPDSARERIEALQGHFRALQPTDLSGQAYLHPMRVALTGMRQSMNAFEYLAAQLHKKAGKELVVDRLNAAIAVLLQ